MSILNEKIYLTMVFWQEWNRILFYVLENIHSLLKCNMENLPSSSGADYGQSVNIKVDL